MNILFTPANLHNLLDDMRAVVGRMTAMVVVLSDINLDTHKPQVIENYLDVLIDLSRQAEQCCADLDEAQLNLVWDKREAV